MEDVLVSSKVTDTTLDSHTQLNGLEHLTLPMEIRQIALDIGRIERQIRNAEASGKDKSFITDLWMNIVSYKNEYKGLTGLMYTTPSELSRGEKGALSVLFYELGGFTWSKNFGWAGQSKQLTRREVAAFESYGSLFDSIRTTDKEVLPDPKQLKSKASKGAPDSVGAPASKTTNVKAINFTGIGCQGKLPENKLAAFEQCEFLMLNWNAISGSLPPNVGSLTKLQKLNLAGNLLTGTLTKRSFAKLGSMVVLDLSFNRFEGPLKDDIFSECTNLEVLNLAGNKFEGDFPASIATLPFLRILKLQANRFSGAIPESVVNLNTLRELNLSQNNFSSGFTLFNQCTNLEVMQLNNNSFVGTLDPSLSNLKTLDILYMQNNQLTGLIPNEICSLTRLRRLNLSNNKIRGILPKDIGDMKELQTLRLTDNLFVGPVPISIGNLSNLKDFHIFKGYPSEATIPPRGFNKATFDRIHVFGPSQGLDSIHWEYPVLYGRERTPEDDKPCTIFTGKI